MDDKNLPELSTDPIIVRPRARCIISHTSSRTNLSNSGNDKNCGKIKTEPFYFGKKEKHKGMATAASFASPALRPKPEAFPLSSLLPPTSPSPSGSGSSSNRSRKNLFFSSSKSKHSISISRLASNPPPSTPEKPPEIELEFVGVTPHILFVFSPHPKASRIPSFILLSIRRVQVLFGAGASSRRRERTGHIRWTELRRSVERSFFATLCSTTRSSSTPHT